jgi:hypothetical protein
MDQGQEYVPFVLREPSNAERSYAGPLAPSKATGILPALAAVTG